MPSMCCAELWSATSRVAAAASSTAARNKLAKDNSPWIELAMPGELDRNHPNDPTFRGGRGAMFWYNPVRGIVRARVPDQTTDEATFALYESINGDAWQP